MKLTLAEVLFALGVALICAAASWLGLSKALGAHPWWAARSGLIGAGLAFGLFVPARGFGVTPKWIAVTATLALVAAVVSAQFAKSAFVSAEDFNPAAGRVWYYGWITVWASVALLCSALFSMFSKGHSGK